MPYISTERVAEIRKELKATFPDVKFSVVREHYSTVRVAVMESPLEWGDTRTINPFYPENAPNPEFCRAVIDIMDAGNSILFHDGDYGAVPKWYTSLEIGKWDRPHIKRPGA